MTIKAPLISTFLATILLGYTANVSAAAKASIIPEATPGFAISLTALYLQPGASNLDYAVYTQPLPAPAPHWDQKNVNPDYQPAFNLGLQYTFSDKVDSVKFDWLHLSTKDTDFASASGSASIAPPYYFGPLAQALFNSSANTKAEFNVDNANLVFDRSINLGNRIQIQPFIGLSSVYLKQYLTTNFQGENSDDDPYSITSYNTSKYMGIGPRLGLSTNTFITHHLSILAEMGADIFVGSMKSDTSFLSEGRDNPTAVKTSLADQSVTRVVPELDGKLGLTYSFLFRSGGSLAIQAGYMVSVYFNGINQVNPTALVANQFNNGVIAVETSGQTQSDLDLNGPYLKLIWKF